MGSVSGKALGKLPKLHRLSLLLAVLTWQGDALESHLPAHRCSFMLFLMVH